MLRLILALLWVQSVMSYFACGAPLPSPSLTAEEAEISPLADGPPASPSLPNEPRRPSLPELTAEDEETIIRRSTEEPAILESMENQPVMEASSPQPPTSQERNIPNPIRYATSSSSQGYSVRTTRIPISTMTRDAFMIITLSVGLFEDFTTTVEGNEILIEINMGEGLMKHAVIKIPRKYKASEVMIERSPDSIILTGPSNTRPGAGGVSTSSRSNAKGGVNFASASSFYIAPAEA